MSDPFTDPGGWSRCVLGGMTTPGLCEIDCPRENGWDIKTGKGADGGICTFVGRPPIKDIKATFTAWEIEHFEAWDLLLPLLKYAPTKGQPVTALPIYHPALAKLDVTAVVVTKLTNWKHAGDGEWTFEVTFVEYRPPPPVSAVATPGQSTDLPNANGSTPDPRVVALRQANADLMKRAQQAYQ
jgi:hypothetical protein